MRFCVRRLVTTMLRVAAFCLASVSVFAQGDAALTASEDLSQRLTALSSFAADFSQTLRDDSGAVLQESRGRTRVMRPGKLYWESLAPYSSLTIASGSSLWRYDRDLEQVSRENLSGDLRQTPALLLSGDTAALDSSFAVQRDGAGSFSLTPLNDSGLFKSLQLRFDDQGVIASMTIVDDLQQRTEIVFTDATANAPVDESVFEFVPPPGVDVMGEMPADRE